MFIVLREKVGEPQGAGRHFLKKRGSPIPFIPNGVSTPSLNMSKPINSGGAAISSSPARLGDRFNVILSENASPPRTEGSRYVTLKVPQRDSSIRQLPDSE